MTKERPTTFISLTPVKRKTTTDPSLLTPSTTKPTTLLSTTETSAGIECEIFKIGLRYIFK